MSTEDRCWKAITNFFESNYNYAILRTPDEDSDFDCMVVFDNDNNCYRFVDMDYSYSDFPATTKADNTFMRSWFEENMVSFFKDKMDGVRLVRCVFDEIGLFIMNDQAIIRYHKNIVFNE